MKKGHMWTVLGPVCFDPFKSNYDQVTVQQILTLKLCIFSHNSHGKNVVIFPKMMRHSEVIVDFVKNILFFYLE